MVWAPMLGWAAIVGGHWVPWRDWVAPLGVWEIGELGCALAPIAVAKVRFLRSYSCLVGVWRQGRDARGGMLQYCNIP